MLKGPDCSKLLFSFILFFLFACFTNAVNAQTGLLKFDGLDLSKKYPFDQEFYLKINKEDMGVTISKLMIYKIDNGDKMLFGPNEKVRILSCYKPYDAAKDDRKFISYEKSDDIHVEINRRYANKSCFIDSSNYFLVKVFQLNPNQKYLFRYLLAEGIKKEQLYDATFNVLKGSKDFLSSKDLLKPETIINLVGSREFAEAIRKMIVYDSNSADEESTKLKDSYKKLFVPFDDYNKLNIQDLKAFEDYYQLVVERLILPTQLYSNDSLKKSCFSCIEPVKLSVFSASDLIAKGLISYKDGNDLNVCKEYDLPSRINNLRKTYGYMDDIISRTKFLIDESDSIALKGDTITLGNLIQDCNLLLASLKIEISALEELNKKMEQFYEKVANYYTKETGLVMATFKEEAIELNTSGEITIESKGRFSLRPMVGVAWTTNLINSMDVEYSYNSIVPFVGFNLNFRALNPSIDYREIHSKNFWHHSSLNFAFSLISIETVKENRYDLYSNNTFLLGYGYRLNNALTINLGSMFFNKKNNDPLRNNKQLAAMPYIGLTIDSGVLPQTKTFFNEIFK